MNKHVGDNSQVSPFLRSAVRIQQLRVQHYRIPLHHPFITTHSALATREGAIVEIFTAEGIIGIGEIAPMPDFSGGNLNDALTALHQSAVLNDLVGQGLDVALNSLYRAVDRLPTSTVYGLELALLDALGQAQQCSISELLSQRSSQSNATYPHRSVSMTPRIHIHVNAVIGASARDTAVKHAQAAVAAGFRCLKLKLGMDIETDIERVQAVRRAIGPAVYLRLDANEAWNFDQAYTILTQCAPFDIQYVEQPLKASDLTGMRNLRQAIAIPIAADEAVYDLASARRVFAAQAADILILKPQLVGGLHVSQQIIQEARTYKVHCVITSAMETGIGIVGALHLVAASPEIVLECGLATLPILEDDLLSEELPIRDGTLTVPTGTGLGVHLDRQALAKYTVPT